MELLGEVPGLQSTGGNTTERTMTRRLAMDSMEPLEHRRWEAGSYALAIPGPGLAQDHGESYRSHRNTSSCLGHWWAHRHGSASGSGVRGEENWVQGD